MKRKMLLGLCAFDRGTLATPFSFEWKDETWDCATDGKASLILRGATWEKRDSPDIRKKVIVGMDKCDNSVPVENLLEYSFGGDSFCSSCRGTSCTIDDDHCYSCDNGIEQVQCGSVGDLIFNRRLLYKFLLVGNTYAPRKKPHAIIWGDPLSPFFVRGGDDMLIAMMPMREAVGRVEPLIK